MAQFRVRNDQGFNGYGLHLGAGQVRLFKSVRQTDPAQSQLLASHALPGGTPLGQWYDLEVRALGPAISVAVDGSEIMRFADQLGPLLQGSIALGIYDGAGGQPLVDFDDVLIQAPPWASLALNQSRFGPGDLLRLGLDVVNPAGPAADLYFGVVLPDGAIICLAGTGAVLAPPCPPFRPALQGFALSAPSFIEATIPPGGIPPGSDLLVAALLLQGALEDGSFEADELLSLELKGFTFSP
jgi:hypothetical protein